MKISVLQMSCTNITIVFPDIPMVTSLKIQRKNTKGLPQCLHEGGKGKKVPFIEYLLCTTK
jgi:hypothetical protein